MGIRKSIECTFFIKAIGLATKYWHKMKSEQTAAFIIEENSK